MQVTDTVNPPFVVFSTPPTTLPAVVSGDVNFELTARLVRLNNNTVAGATTLSELFSNPDALEPIAGAVAYSEAFAFSVQLADVATRAEWTVRPALVLMVAHSTDVVGLSAVTISDSAQLDVDFCGLNSTDLVAAWVIMDGGASSGAGAEPDTLVDAASWASGTALTSLALGTSLANAFSPSLLATLQQAALTNNFTDIAGLQGSIMPRGVPPQAVGRVAVVPDSSGGFALPVRNRFFNSTAYAISFCAVTVVEPYSQLVVGNPAGAQWTFPAYTSRAAALADTGTVGGLVPPPIAVSGAALGAGDALLYFVPAAPASTAGVICGSSAVLGVAASPPNSSQCQALIQPAAGASRRRVLATHRPLSVRLTLAAAPRPHAAAPVARAMFLAQPPPGPPSMTPAARADPARGGRDSSDHELPVAATVGIVVGSAGGIAAIAAGLFMYMRTKRRKSPEPDPTVLRFGARASPPQQLIRRRMRL